MEQFFNPTIIYWNDWFSSFCRSRIRPVVSVPEAKVDYRCSIEKQWAYYKLQERKELNDICARLLKSQTKALDELRKESEILYQAAIQPMDNLVPLTVKGPVYTAPIKDYLPPAKYRSIPISFLLAICSNESRVLPSRIYSFFCLRISIQQDGDYKDVTRKWE